MGISQIRSYSTDNHIQNEKFIIKILYRIFRKIISSLRLAQNLVIDYSRIIVLGEFGNFAKLQHEELMNKGREHSSNSSLTLHNSAIFPNYLFLVKFRNEKMYLQSIERILVLSVLLLLLLLLLLETHLLQLTRHIGYHQVIVFSNAHRIHAWKSKLRREISWI